MAADLTLPDGWSIGFDSDASVDPVQYRASLHQGRALRCQFCVTEKGATPESAAQHLHGLALKWIVAYAQRPTLPVDQRPGGLIA